jgi:GAF domain-containing protein/HAMP domain-containing protein
MTLASRLSPDQLLKLVGRLRYLSLMLAGASFASAILSLFILISTANWGLVFLVAGNLIIFFAALTNVYDISRGELGNTWRMVGIVQVAYILSSFFVSGQGALAGLTVAVLTVAFMAQMPTRIETHAGRIPAWVPYSAAISGIATYLLDIYWPLQRFILFMPWLAVWVVVAAIPLVVYALFSFYNFGTRPLRIKLVITFLLVSMVAVLPIVTFLNWSNRNTLIERESSKLLSLAEQAANELDQFLANTLNNTKVEASFNDFALYIGLSPTERQIGWEAIIQNTMQELRQRDEQNIVSYALLDATGTIIADSAGESTGQNVASADYFMQVLNTGKSYVSPVLAERNAQNSDEYFLYFTAPIHNSDNVIVGVLRLKYKADILQNIIAKYNDQAGLSSFAILVDEYNVRLGHGRDPAQLYKTIYRSASDLGQLQVAGRLPSGAQDLLSTNLFDLDQKLRQSGSQPIFTSYISEEAERTATLSRIAVSPMSVQPWKIIFTQEESATLQPLQLQSRWVGLLVLGIGGLLVLLSLGVSGLYTSPVNRLTEAAANLAGGNLDARVDFKNYEDEFGLLGLTFNNMTAQIRQSVTTLETRVAERTRDLELRAFQLQTAAEIGSIASTIRDINKLLPDVTELLSDRFGFYHVGVFLVDEAGEYAVLQAANSQGGRRMLARGHRLQVGATGIVGYVTATGQPRISLDVGEDAVFFNNPDLPNTRSEMALPLVARGNVIGALDIQSDESNAFTESDVTILRVVAEQVAIAIENARLFVELEQAAAATRRAYGEVTERAWADYTGSQTVRGYVARGYRGSAETDVILPLDVQPSSSLAQAMQDVRSGSVVQLGSHTLAVPIKFRTLVLGAVRLQKEDLANPWTNDEINVIQNLADQLGATLENARLYRETQRAASRDRMVREIGDHMRRAPDMDALIQTAIREMSRILDVNQAFAQISVDSQAFTDTASGNGGDHDGHHVSGEMV